MAVRVLVVDDSVFRNRISQILRQDRRIQIVGTAKNGREAIEQAVQLNPDVVTMDVEMPVLNGIEAVKGIMKDAPCQILMLSSLTRRSARVTLERWMPVLPITWKKTPNSGLRKKATFLLR
ncbi:response regulator [Aliamphritea spongicola]|nr:response regulator [Aliamphritea spongicola]